MPKKESSPLDSGLGKSGSKAAAPAAGISVELFGHVTLVEGYALPNFQGCHALVLLRDTPNKTVAVLTSQHSLQTLLETALATGNLIAFRGSKSSTPPTPLGGTWAVDVYLIDSIILYGMK
jgi:hypothetical protein